MFGVGHPCFAKIAVVMAFGVFLLYGKHMHIVTAPLNKEAMALYQDTIDEALTLRKKQLLDSTKETKITWWGTTYQKSKESELLLGLDLQGGISVTLDVALDGLIKGLANNPRDPQLLKALDLANKRKVSSSGNLIDLFAQSYKEINPNSKLAPVFSNANRNKIKYDDGDNSVISYLHEMASAAMKQTYQVLQKRIDKFGVVQPSISLDENRAIISVELAGATDPERVRKYLQSSANLQFWEVYNVGELQNSLVNADKALQNYLNGVKADTSLNKPDSAKLITEIQMLRTEVDILHARMRIFELQLKELQGSGADGEKKAAG